MKQFLPIIIAIFATFSFTNTDAQVKKPSAKKTVVTPKKKPGKPTTYKVKDKDKDKIKDKDKVKDKNPADQTIRIRIITDSGTMIVKLYDSTPLHRDNFAKLVNQGFYDSLMFHRVIPQFMIQGGDPLSKNATAGVQLGNGGGDMARIPAEFNPALVHKKGVLAAARDNNPEKASSACQFYIVQGKLLNDAELDMLENRKKIKYSAADREYYKTKGGTPMLDMEYTVFGELESGHEVVDKIASVPRDMNNRPAGDIRMRMEIIK